MTSVIGLHSSSSTPHPADELGGCDRRDRHNG